MNTLRSTHIAESFSPFRRSSNPISYKQSPVVTCPSPKRGRTVLGGPLEVLERFIVSRLANPNLAHCTQDGAGSATSVSLLVLLPLQRRKLAHAKVVI
jgi:hypothetical protein